GAADADEGGPRDDGDVGVVGIEEGGGRRRRRAVARRRISACPAAVAGLPQVPPWMLSL
ncbi:unnamed protein product, partial [Urochloa humidicola]